MDPGVEVFDDLRMGRQAQDPSTQAGDFPVRDRLGNWTYQWAVTIDDFLQGVTHVIRGEDLLDSTGRQIRLARLAGRTKPATFLHHSLIMGPAGRKLSKSDGATGIRELRHKGLSKEEVFSMALQGPPR
jgi:glutamyl-tRNA synthetase/glutamyl-Q tRNA(Asp) synthetase